MASGETTVGGIVGFLRLDADQFNRAIDEAMAKVKLIDHMDADVSVKADTRSAETSLDKVAAKTDVVSRRAASMNRSFGGRGLFSAPVIIGGIAAAVALLGPVTAAATATVAGFTGAIAVGALAWKGFKDEIAQGTELGNSLHTQLAAIKGDITGLAATAATAMGPGLLAGLQRIDEFLPELDGNVNTLGKHLGNALDISAEGLIDGLRTAMPLLQDGGDYAELFALKLRAFANSQDFKNFIAYARRELPDVMQAVGSLTKGLVDLTVSLAPLGEDLIQVIGLLGDMATVAGKVTEGGVGVLGWISGVGLVAKAYHLIHGEAKPAADAVKEYGDATANSTENTITHAIAAQNMISAYGGTVGALDTAQAAQQKQAVASAAATLQMQLENNAAGLLKQSLDLLNGKTLDVSSAQTAAASATLQVVNALKQNGTSLSLNTQKGVANRQAIEGKVRADQQAAEAIAQSTGSTKKGTDALQASKKALEDDLRARGLLTAKVQAYIDTLYKVPKNVPPTKIDVDKKAADEQLAALEAHLTAVTRPRTATVTVTTIGSGRYAGKTVPDGAAAGGGTVGGHGGPTADDQLYWLSTGEEVINAKSAAKWRPLLKALNADGLAKGGTAGFASGGTAGVNARLIDELGQDLGGQVAKAFADGMSSGKGSVKSVANEIRSIVADNAKKASDEITSLMKEQADYATSLASKFTGLGDVTSFDPTAMGRITEVGPDGVERDVTAQSSIAGMLQSARSQTQSFEATLKRLKALGARTDILQQLLDKGPEAAGAAAALASLGKSGIAGVNADQARLVSAAGSLGQFGAGLVYAPKLQAARQSAIDSKALEVAVQRATGGQLAELKKVTAEGRATNVALSKLAGQLADALSHQGAKTQAGERNRPRS